MAGLANKAIDKSGKMMVNNVVGYLFMSRDYAHRAHLKTPSYSKHIALNEFYDGIIELVDQFAEVGQGAFGKLDVTVYALEGNVADPIAGLQGHLDKLMKLGKGCEIGALRNIMDEIQALYLQTLYKMKELS